jgi:hypothetical protein
MDNNPSAPDAQSMEPAERPCREGRPRPPMPSQGSAAMVFYAVSIKEECSFAA